MSRVNFQSLSDNVIEKLFLWAIPKWLRPNPISISRIIMAPFVLILLSRRSYFLGILLFIFAVCTDFIDGALARKRDQVTDLGKILDPIADKVLILSIFLFIGFDYLIVYVFTIFVILEVIAVISGAAFSEFVGRPIGANLYGKIKMILQSSSLFLFLAGIALGKEQLISISEGVLVVALLFALISAIEQIYNKIRFLKTDKNFKKMP